MRALRGVLDSNRWAAPRRRAVGARVAGDRSRLVMGCVSLLRPPPGLETRRAPPDFSTTGAAAAFAATGAVPLPGPSCLGQPRQRRLHFLKFAGVARHLGDVERRLQVGDRPFVGHRQVGLRSPMSAGLSCVLSLVSISARKASAARDQYRLQRYRVGRRSAGMGWQTWGAPSNGLSESARWRHGADFGCTGTRTHAPAQGIVVKGLESAAHGLRLALRAADRLALCQRRPRTDLEPRTQET